MPALNSRRPDTSSHEHVVAFRREEQQKQGCQAVDGLVVTKKVTGFLRHAVWMTRDKAGFLLDAERVSVLERHGRLSHFVLHILAMTSPLQFVPSGGPPTALLTMADMGLVTLGSKLQGRL